MLDLGFAVSANSRQASVIFQKLKNVIKEIISRYGRGQIRYGLIVFGSSATTKVNFDDVFATEDDLQKFVEAVPRVSGRPALESALAQAKMLFERSNRPDSKKVLVVLTDSKSAGSLDNVRKRSKALHDRDVTIIGVGIGGDTDVKDLEAASTDKQDALLQTLPIDSNGLATKIMTLVMKGNFCYTNWVL